jgi:hypothetical protein
LIWYPLDAAPADGEARSMERAILVNEIGLLLKSTTHKVDNRIDWLPAVAISLWIAWRALGLGADIDGYRQMPIAAIQLSYAHWHATTRSRD